MPRPLPVPAAPIQVWALPSGACKHPRWHGGVPKCLISSGGGRKAKGDLSSKPQQSFSVSPTNPLPRLSLLGQASGQVPLPYLCLCSWWRAGQRSLSALRPCRLRRDGWSNHLDACPVARPARLNPTVAGTGRGLSPRDSVARASVTWDGLLASPPRVCNCPYGSSGRGWKETPRRTGYGRDCGPGGGWSCRSWGLCWAASSEGWLEQPHGMPHGRALGSWRPPSSGTDPSLGACPALPCPPPPGMPWGEPWQRVLPLHRDPKTTCWGLQHPYRTGG